MEQNGKNRRPKTKKSQNRRFSDRSKEERETKVEGKSRINDPSWYVKEPQLARDVASFSFNNAAGAKYVLLPDNPGGSAAMTGFDLGKQIPGIMTIHTGPSVPPSMSASSALNLATKNLYKRVRKANSGSTNYDASDLMIYILAMDSLYSAVFWLQRIYGCATVYSQVNRYIGDALIAAQGVQPQSVRANLANYRARLNMLITKLSSFATPMDIALFKRHAWMYQGIYLDESVKKAQMYMYNPAFIWKFNEVSGAPGKLEPLWLGCTYIDVDPIHAIRARTNFTDTTDPQFFKHYSEIFTIVESALSAVVESQDMNVMSGDVLKAYDSDIWRMELVGEDYATIPVFSDEVLDQIHNSTFVGNLPSATLDLTQPAVPSTVRLGVAQAVTPTGNYLLYNPQFIDAPQIAMHQVLDMCDDNPTPERVLVATRNMVSGNCSPTSKTNQVSCDVVACGSDLCLFYTMFSHDENGDLFPATIYAGADMGSAVTIAKYCKFHKAPLQYKFAANNKDCQCVYGEVGNFTILDHYDLQKLHESAALSLLGVSV